MSNMTNHTACAIAPFQPPTNLAAVVIQLDTHSHWDDHWNTASILSKCTNSSALTGLYVYGNETAKLGARHVDLDNFCWEYGIVGSCNATADPQYKCFDDSLKEHGVNATASSWCFPARKVEEPKTGEGFKGGVKGWAVFGLAVVAVLGGI